MNNEHRQMRLGGDISQVRPVYEARQPPTAEYAYRFLHVQYPLNEDNPEDSARHDLLA